MTTRLVGGKYDGWDNANVPAEYLKTDEGVAAMSRGAAAQEELRVSRQPVEPEPESESESESESEPEPESEPEKSKKPKKAEKTGK